MNRKSPHECKGMRLCRPLRVLIRGHVYFCKQSRGPERVTPGLLHGSADAIKLEGSLRAFEA